MSISQCGQIARPARAPPGCAAPLQRLERSVVIGGGFFIVVVVLSDPPHRNMVAVLVVLVFVVKHLDLGGLGFRIIRVWNMVAVLVVLVFVGSNTWIWGV